MPIDAQDSFLSTDAIDRQLLMANDEPGAHPYIRYRSPKHTSDESCETRKGDNLFAHMYCGVNGTELGVAEKLSPDCEDEGSLSLFDNSCPQPFQHNSCPYFPMGDVSFDCSDKPSESA